MTLSKAILFLCFMLLSTPALAEEAAAPAAPGAVTPSTDGGPIIKLNVDPAIEKLETAYKDAIKNLSKEQLETLKNQEEAYMKTTNADIVLFSTGLQLKHCTENNADIKKNASKYQSEFGVLRNQIQAAQRAQQGRLRAARETTVTFVDQKVLDDHYSYLSKMVAGLGQGMLEASYQKGGFAKTDCQGLARKLDASFGRANSSAPVNEAAIAAKVAEIKQSAESGDTDAMTNLGLMQMSGGTGIPQDKKAGMALLTKAAEKDYGRAQYMLGLVYSSDMFGDAPDKEKAKYWLGKAAAKGDKKAAALMQALDKAPPAESLETTKKKADAGDADAEYILGSRYAQGWGVEKDSEAALKWLLLSAGQGHPLAQSDVAVRLLNANRIPEALDWMTKAANKGVTNSQFELASIYLDGKLVQQDKDKAVFWFKKAADAGDSRAIQILQEIGK
ncbi:MAG: tetratricopeptide repeat protein [Alphaproteobacteria bacterium]